MTPQPPPATQVDLEELEAQAKGDLAGAAKFRNHIPSTPVPTLTLLSLIEELAELRAMAEAWSAIEQWHKADDNRHMSLGPQYMVDDWYVSLYLDNTQHARRESFGAPTRAEALSKAAAWCRSQPPAPPEAL